MQETTLTGGLLIDGNFTEGSGAGISVSYGTVTVSNSIITGNNGNYGGGAWNSGGSLTIMNSVVSENTAQGGGGAMPLS